VVEIDHFDAVFFHQVAVPQVHDKGLDYSGGGNDARARRKGAGEVRLDEDVLFCRPVVQQPEELAHFLVDGAIGAPENRDLWALMCMCHGIPPLMQQPGNTGHI